MTTVTSAALVFLASLVAFLGVLWTVRQKHWCDRNDTCWKRTEWALESSVSESEDSRVVGLAVLEVLAMSDLAGLDEQNLIFAATDRHLGGFEQAAALGGVPA